MAATHLHLLRHADAGDAARWPGPDATRPLSALGIEQAERLARQLAAIGFRCDRVITSPRLRALETAEPIAAALDLRAVVDERLGESLSLEHLDQILAAAGDPRDPILVGHDPDFSELLGSLSGARDLSMKKGAMARLDCTRPFTAGTARLRWLLPPELLTPR